MCIFLFVLFTTNSDLFYVQKPTTSIEYLSTWDFSIAYSQAPVIFRILKDLLVGPLDFYTTQIGTLCKRSQFMFMRSAPKIFAFLWI